jgi:hypothetical protein
MNNKMDLISKIPNEIDWSKEIEVNINGYFNEKEDVKDEGIIFNIYPPFERKSIGVLVKWGELEELISDYGFDEDEFIKFIEDKINLY